MISSALPCMGRVLWNNRETVKVAAQTTRIMGKDSWFTSIVLDRVLQLACARGLLEPKGTIVYWSDGGLHYRSVAQLSNNS